MSTDHKIGADSSTAELVDGLKDKTPFIKNMTVKILLTFIFIAVITVFQQKSLYLTGAIIAFVQAIIWITGMPKTREYLETIALQTWKSTLSETGTLAPKKRKGTWRKIDPAKAARICG